METEEKIIRVEEDLSSKHNSGDTKKALGVAISDYKDIKKLIDLFMFGMFLVLIMYIVL